MYTSNLGLRGRFLRECSGGDDLLGSAPAWLSLLIMLLIGFILGGAVGILWSTRRQRRHQQPSEPRTKGPPELSWASAAAEKQRSIATAGLSGGPSPRGGPLGRSLATPGSNPPYVIRATSLARSAEEPRFAGYQPSDTTPQGDLATVAQTLSQQKSLPKSRSIPSTSDNPFTAGGAVGKQTDPRISKPGQDVVPDMGSAPEAITPSQQEMDARKQARKAQDAARVAQEYELDELTDEWQSTLQTMDEHLLQKGRPTLDGRERAVVMRCLIESTARESTDTAVHRALGTVERLRRMHAAGGLA